MIHWLLHQLWLTWHEIQREITIPHTVTGMIGYGMVHLFYSWLHARQMSAVKRLRSVRHQLVWIHIKSGHKGRFYGCARCEAIRETNLAQQQGLSTEQLEHP